MTDSAVQSDSLAAGEGVLEAIPVAALVLSKHNPRRSHDPAKHQELTDSIRRHGVIQPIVVRRISDSTVFEIVCGERRYRAAAAAKLTALPSIVRVLTDDQVQDFRLIENLDREDLSPLDEALGYKALVKQRKPIEEIAARVGKSVSYVYQRLKLADLIPEAQKAMQTVAGFTAGHAVQIARLQPADQARALDACLGVHHGTPKERAAKRAAPEQVASVKELARFIAEQIHLNLNKAPFAIADAQLVEKAGACTTCPKRTGWNRDLFADIGKEDVCTDPACYQSKVAAHVQERIKTYQTENNGKAPLRLSRDWRTPPAKTSTGLLAEQQYVVIDWCWPARLAKKELECAHQQGGVMADGQVAGEIVTVCASVKACSKHWRDGHKRYDSSTGASPEAARQNKAQAQKLRLVKETRARVFTKILAAAPNRLAPADLQRAAVALFDHLPGQIQKSVYAGHDWKPPKKRFAWGSFDQYGGADLLARLGRVSDRDLAHFIVELCCAPEAHVGAHETPDGTPPLMLAAFARRAKVSYSGIERQVRKELTAKKPKTQKLHTSAKAARPKGAEENSGGRARRRGNTKAKAKK
jgi:ParB family chromosome partitioning protein